MDSGITDACVSSHRGLFHTSSSHRVVFVRLVELEPRHISPSAPAEVSQCFAASDGDVRHAVLGVLIDIQGCASVAVYMTCRFLAGALSVVLRVLRQRTRDEAPPDEYLHSQRTCRRAAYAASRCASTLPHMAPARASLLSCSTRSRLARLGPLRRQESCTMTRECKRLRVSRDAFE